MSAQSKTLNVFYKGRYIEMLEETYDKFKLQLKMKKTGNNQLPEIVYHSDEQVHHITTHSGGQRAIGRHFRHFDRNKQLMH